MKLYTEEQVNKIALQSKDWGHYDNSITPIELPSDDEIEYNAISSTGEFDYEERISFEKGAKWMKKQILNQNK